MRDIILGISVLANHDSYEGNFKYWSKGELATVTGLLLNSAEITIMVEFPKSGYFEEFKPADFSEQFLVVQESLEIH